MSICSAYKRGKNISNKFGGVVSYGATTRNNGEKWPCDLMNLCQSIKFWNSRGGGISNCPFFQEGRSALILASNKVRVEIIKYLIEAKASLDLQTQVYFV